VVHVAEQPSAGVVLASSHCSVPSIVPLPQLCPWHVPPEHVTPVLHFLPHAPQLLTSVCEFVSQPFDTVPSQFK